MAENQKIKIKNNLQINFHNLISKPSYLITINPDKFLQKSSYNSAMSIKERDEINPEMAEIVRKIISKRKKDNNKNRNDNNSFKKERKNNSLQKYFDDNYNKKHGVNKENYYNNQTFVLDSLNDRVGHDNKNLRYFDYVNKSVNNKIKIIRKKRPDDTRSSYSVPRYRNKNLEKTKIPPCQLLNYSTMPNNSQIDDIKPDYKGLNTETNFHKKKNKIINIDLNDDPKLNSITFDEDKINKDESIINIKCDYSYNETITPKNFFDKRNNEIDKEKITLNKNNYIDDKNLGTDSIVMKNLLDKKFNEINNDSKKNIIGINNINKNNYVANKKLYNKIHNQNQINQNKFMKNNRLIFNNSQEHRNKYELIKSSHINKNINNQFNLTITNNFFKNNLNINNIHNNFFKINNNIKKTRLNLSANKRDKNIKIVKNNIKNLNQKINNKNSYNDIISKNLNNNVSKVKSSPFHSKNSSNISTELSHKNNNKKTKIIKNNMNKIKDNNKKILIINKKKLNENNLYFDYMKKKIEKEKENINKEIKTDRMKTNSKLIISKKEDNLKKQNLLKNESNKSLNYISNNNSQKLNKKEYPNMAIIKGRETKYIKKIESLCKKGYSGPGIKKTNQDNFFIYNNFNNNSNYVYLGVCDGHGIFGQDISTYLVNNLPHNMNKKIMSKELKNLSNTDISVLSKLFQETFKETNISLNSDERIDSSYSGSTCVSILFTPNKLYCINVGDSRSVLGKYLEKEKKWISMNLSRDHKPSEPDEMLRIKKFGGIVESYRDNFGNFVGPERVWGGDMEGPGLAMSRSFGDEKGHEIGVVVDPEILEHFFEKDDKFIVMGSDGIWEFISNEEVVDIVKDYYLENNVEGAIEHIYNEASKRWIMEEHIIDDITVIIIFLN